MPEPAPPLPLDRQQRRQRILRLARHPVRFAGESLRALFELARARWALSRLTVARIEQGNRQALAAAHTRSSSADPELVERVMVMVPMVAWRVPWRSDCLVQALAAQRWLRAGGVASRIVIGADATAREGFVAHAWLIESDRVVTGGEVDRYTVLFDSAEPKGAG